MRRFEHAGKFWEVLVLGPRVQMRWGDLGTFGRVFDRGFATEAEAEVFAERQVIAQRERGYIETTAPPRRDRPEVTVERHQRFVWRAQFEEVSQEGVKLTVRGGKIAGGRDVPDRDRLEVTSYATVHAASVAFDERCAQIRERGGVVVDAEPTHATRANAELEAECEASPGDPTPWAVYADWLIAHGDARGEIAALQRDGRAEEAKRLLGIHLLDLAGTGAGKLAFEFRHGFATHATVSVDPGEEILEEVTRAVLASPLGRFLESLRFGLAGHDDENDWTPTIHAVARSPRAHAIRALHFAPGETDDAVDLSWIAHGDFSGVWPRLPALERLHVRSGAGGRLGHMVLPNLRVLVRESSGLARAELDEILAAELPILEHLALWLGSRDYGAECDSDALRPILDGRFPTLRHLGIVNSEVVAALLPELARAKVLPGLRTLDLSRGVLATDGANTLVAHAEAFRHLEKLDVSSNFLTAEDLALLERALPNIVSMTQRSAADDEERVVEVGE